MVKFPLTFATKQSFLIVLRDINILLHPNKLRNSIVWSLSISLRLFVTLLLCIQTDLSVMGQTKILVIPILYLYLFRATKQMT